jgi:hypothetical protein
MVWGKLDHAGQKEPVLIEVIVEALMYSTLLDIKVKVVAVTASQ